MTWSQKKRRAALCICLVAICLLYAGYTVLRRSRRIACLASERICLKQLGIELLRYALDHNGRLPESLAGLYPEYLTEPRLLSSPYDPAVERELGKVKSSEQLKRLIDAGTCSYRYVRCLDDTRKAEDKERIIVLFGKVHKGKDRQARLALFLDAHVDALDPNQFNDAFLNMLTFDHVSPEQRAYWRGFIDGMKAEGEG